MNGNNKIVGIDVFNERYNACILDLSNGNIKNYTGSAALNSGINRLLNRIDKKDVIYISESQLAAKIALIFKDNVTIINLTMISLLNSAGTKRGKELATFYCKNFESSKKLSLSKSMKNKILIEGQSRLTQMEKLIDEGESLIESAKLGKKIDFERALDLEQSAREFAGQSSTLSNKIADIEEIIEEFEKLNKL